MSMLFTYIGEYLFSFSLYGLIAVIVAIVSCLIRMKKTGQRKFWTIRNALTLLFAFYLTCLLTVTVLPRLDFYYMLQDGEWGIETYSGMGRIYRKPNIIPFREIINDFTGNADDSALNLLGNIAMFLPYGFLLPVVSRRRGFRINVVPLLNSVAIEVLQFFEGRRCDIDDVILNLTGAVIGWMLFRMLRHMSRTAQEE